MLRDFPQLDPLFTLVEKYPESAKQRLEKIRQGIDYREEKGEDIPERIDVEGAMLDTALEKLAAQSAQISQQASQLEETGASVLNPSAFEEEEDQ